MYAQWRHKFHLILRTKTKFFLRLHTYAATWISSAFITFYRSFALILSYRYYVNIT